MKFTLNAPALCALLSTMINIGLGQDHIIIRLVMVLNEISLGWSRGAGGSNKKGLFYSDLDLMKSQWWIIRRRDGGFAHFQALHWEDWVARSS